MSIEPVSGSFRDPAGFVYRRDGVLLRQIQPSYLPTWNSVVGSGLYADLVDRGLLVPYQDAPLELAARPGAAAVLQPEEVPFISFPYEWCFSALKDAALATLATMARALEAGFWLRDASAYNIQFYRGGPTLIDSLSFGIYEPGKPWPAYGQFCRHFLAPLALMSFVDARMGDLMRSHIDGIPLDLAAKILPRKSRWSLGLGVHLHLHARAQSGESKKATTQVSKQAIQGMIASLESTVRKLQPPSGATTWGEYYDHTNYVEASFDAKKSLVSKFLRLIEPSPRVVWDLGANTGVFSEVASEIADHVVAWDFDPLAVERAYVKWKGNSKLLALRQDLTNPSPALGWAHKERPSLGDRGPADALLVLALIHHLAIGNNVPLPSIAAWLNGLSRACILEFVPKEDSQVQRMLSSREDVFPDYCEEGFETAIEPHFKVVRKDLIEGTKRTLYLLETR